MSGKPKQRMISLEDVQSPIFQAVPDVAKPTAMGLWMLLDVMGRGPMDELWIARELYRDRDPSDVVEMVTEHLLMMLESGFMTTYLAEGREWILLLKPLKADLRRAKIVTPEPPPAAWAPPEVTWTSVAGERERAGVNARAEVRAEDAARAEAWATVQAERGRVHRPERPILLDAPPIGCPKHPDGLVNGPCGPCGTARIQREEWLTRRIYEERMTRFYEQQQDAPDDEPF